MTAWPFFAEAAKHSKSHETNDTSDASPTPASVEKTKSESETDEQPKKREIAPNASLSTEDLSEFSKQPAGVQRLIESALALTKQNLTYTYGSADPANGGMDCSGFLYYVLRQNGFKDAPRQASEQYIWLRKAKTFEAVLSRKRDSFELADLKPGDILFWTGTYATDHDPPVSHSMIYLGTEKRNGNRVMVGSSDGRSYEGKPRWGVSVFDFKPESKPDEKTTSRFVGYARVPND